MAGSSVNPRFIITANISITTKDIIPGPPQMIAQNMDITLFIGDAIENKVFANTIISTKGIGTNENKAFIDAIKQINTKNKGIQSFLEEGKTKIISYYSTQCDFIVKKAESLKELEKYSEAIYTLALVPEVCKDCYLKCSSELSAMYDLKINADGKARLNEATAIWAASPNNQGAQQATNLIMQIKPQAKCYSEASDLLKKINEKVIVDEKERLRQQEENYKREHELAKENIKPQAEIEKERINAYREIAVEYIKNQPQVVYRNVYRNIYWR
jgi:predicted Rdx family selenoprotein